MGNIPKTIHHIWWQWRPDCTYDDEERPVPGEHFWRRWQRLHPTYAYRLWRRPEAFAFVQEHFPELYPMFLSYPRPIQRCDLFRVLLLIKEGGVYSDIDVYPYETMDSVFAAYPHANVILGTESTESAALCQKLAEKPIRKGEVIHSQRLGNWWMAAAPNHPLMLAVLHEMQLRAHLPVLEDYDVIYTTGPEVLIKVAHRDLPTHADAVIMPYEQTFELLRHACVSHWRQDMPGQPRKFIT